jgi:hypothetical protein
MILGVTRGVFSVAAADDIVEALWIVGARVSQVNMGAAP